jgi:hypothetical protein
MPALMDALALCSQGCCPSATRSALMEEFQRSTDFLMWTLRDPPGTGQVWAPRPQVWCQRQMEEETEETHKVVDGASSCRCDWEAKNLTENSALRSQCYLERSSMLIILLSCQWYPPCHKWLKQARACQCDEADRYKLFHWNSRFEQTSSMYSPWKSLFIQMFPIW